MIRRSAALLPALLLVLAPTVAAGDPTEPVRENLECLVSDRDCLAPAHNPVACVFGPHVPEMVVYYLVWYCTTDGVVPEPVHHVTGCKVVFGGQLRCDGGSPLPPLSTPVWCVLSTPVQISQPTGPLDCFVG